jgi:hypothetical protein
LNPPPNKIPGYATALSLERVGCDVNCPPTSNTEVREKAKLFLYSRQCLHGRLQVLTRQDDISNVFERQEFIFKNYLINSMF